MKLDVQIEVINQKSIMDAIDILQKKLVGNFYSRFSVGENFGLCFDQFWLIAQNVISSDEEHLNELLCSQYDPAGEAIDKENIAKTAIISSSFRKNIVSVSLGADATLTLVFENGVTLEFPTNTEIVDWHWALNETGDSPYMGYIIGCFNIGEIEVANY